MDRHARITVRCCHYSVPARLVGRQVRVLLRASELIVFDGRQVVARHNRATRKWSTTLVLDHYLEVLLRKPGALPGATALAQARKTGVFTNEHEAFWSAARCAHGDAAGTRELVEVLLLHRHHTHADVVAGLTAALSAGAVRADVVAVEVRRIAQTRPQHTDTTTALEARPTQSAPRVVSLTARRLADPAAVIAGLPPDTRPTPTVTRYDELLGRRQQAQRSGVSDRGEVS